MVFWEIEIAGASIEHSSTTRLSQSWMSHKALPGSSQGRRRRVGTLTGLAKGLQLHRSEY
jgi:hypothetical protein